MFFKKKAKTPLAGRQEYKIPISWGAYYSYKNENGYGIFRLLDFNKDAYHIQIFTEHFHHRPTLAEAERLKPFILHAPIAVAGIIKNEELQIIGRKPLSEEDLQGYDEYQRGMGCDEADVKELRDRIKRMSHEQGFEVVFVRDADGSTQLVLGDTIVQL